MPEKSDWRKTVGILVVDLQGDFTEARGGSLAVQGTDNDYLDRVASQTGKLKAAGFPVIASQDWHPENHMSFYSNHEGRKPFETITVNGREQILWPPHCIRETASAELLLDPGLVDAVVRKGADSLYDSYSAFKDDGGSATGLDGILNRMGVTHLVIYGLAIDFCVRATGIDAVQEGYVVMAGTGLCRGVAPDSTADAVAELRSAGVTLADIPDLETIRAWRNRMPG